MNKLLSLAAVAALFIYVDASACIPAPADQLFAHGTDFVLVGTATGTREERFELLVSYQIAEVLSGKAPAVLTGTSPCQDPIRKGERVVVGSIKGQQYVYPAVPFEQQIRASIRAGR